MLLFDNGFSPFARKVRLVLDHKKLAYDVVDGLLLAEHARLARANGRIEVPTLEDGAVVVVGSSDIVAYLERTHPSPSVYPAADALWVHARAWERCADTTIDPILINLSYWKWAERDDELPAEWLEAGKNDLAIVYDALERDLDGRAFVSGDAISIADIALFPHLVSTRAFGVGHDRATHPRVHAWLARLREVPIFAADLERTKAFLATLADTPVHERKKIFYRGDRIEWLLARGFHPWLMREIEQDRVLWPGLGVPSGRASS